MFDDFAPKLARVITEYSTPIQPGDHVVIDGAVAAMPLIEAVMIAVLKRGGHPVVNLYNPQLTEVFLQEASDDQLHLANATAFFQNEAMDVLIDIEAPFTLNSEDLISPDRSSAWMEGRRRVHEIQNRRVADGGLRWVSIPWPTDVLAQQAGMHLITYQGLVYRSLGLDRPDPVTYWQSIGERQAQAVAWLKGKRRADIKGPGIDLSFSFEDRPWVNHDGKHQLPDGEIFTCPVEDSVNGFIEYSYPSRDVDGIQVMFKDGKAIQYLADKGQDILQKSMGIDEGARRIGVFGIGTNKGLKQVTGRNFTDIKMAGTMHTMLGSGLPEGGGRNKSGIQWVMLHDLHEGEIRIDGTLFYQNGEFVI